MKPRNEALAHDFLRIADTQGDIFALLNDCRTEGLPP
jgi:hypothetical protein